MGDGFSEINNRHTGKGRKLRNQGSRPTGSQTMSFTPEYSSELDWQVGSTSLNAQGYRTDDSEHCPARNSKKRIKETGLVFKEPLV